MGILLNEHMYLRENGTDIEYVSEAGFGLKQKVTDAISKIGAKISELWDKLVKWVQERVEDVRLAFARASVNKKKAEEIANKLGIKRVRQTDSLIELEIPEDISNRLEGDKLFLVVYNINPRFKLSYRMKKIYISLPIVNLEKHFIYYEVRLLNEIINMLNI